MARTKEKHGVSRKKYRISPYIILFISFGGFVVLCGVMIYWAISNPIEPGHTVTGTVTGLDPGKRGILVKLDEGPVVIVGGKKRIPYLKGRRIVLQKVTSGNRKGYRFIGYLEPEPKRGLPPASK